MSPLLFLIKQVGAPGSIGFLALGCAVGLCVIYVWPGRRTLGRLWLFALYSAYLVMGIPAVAHRVAAPMDDRAAGRQPIEQELGTLIVFDGDNAVARIDEAIRIWNGAKPQLVIASAEPWFVERLSNAGIPQERLRVDRSSTTTREQVEYVRAYLASHPGARVAVVASRLQMPRVVALAQRDGVRARFYSSPVDREPPTAGLWRYVPLYAGLRVTRDALYERAALAYYSWRGWIAAGAPMCPAQVS